MTSVETQVSSIRRLVDRLVKEHREFPLQVQALNDGLDERQGLASLREHFVKLQDSLTEHMLTEEFEVYPELMKRGLFTQETSTIMQQHHDLTAQLGQMDLALRIGNLYEFRSTLDALERVLKLHQPAEEEKVFPKAF